MNNKKYASLHNHTDISNASCGFADCINKLPDLINRAIQLGFSALAITDHESVSAHVRATKYYKELLDKAKNKAEENPTEETIAYYNNLKEFKLILGNESYIAREGLSSDNFAKGDRFNHMILLAKDRIGQGMLRDLSSRAWDRSFMRAIMRRYNMPSDLYEVVKTNQGHLIGTTACIGGVTGNHFLNNNVDDAYVLISNFLEGMVDVFGKDNYYIELAPSRESDQIRYNKFMYEKFHDKYNFVIATDSHYLSEDEFGIFKTFLNSKSAKEREVESFYKYSYLMTWEEIEKLCNYLPADFLETCRLNSNNIAAQCENYDLKVSPIIPYIPINEKEVVKSYSGFEDYESVVKFLNSEHLPDRHLIYKIFVGAKEQNVELTDTVLKRINIELNEIWGISEVLNQRMSNYLITMAKVIDIIWEDADSLLGPSRGSAGAFLINYLLGISQWNPLDYPVRMEHWRFISATRPELPDIDIDTPGSKRQEVLIAVAKYFQSIGGSLIQVCTYGTEKAKSAIRTAARGLELDDELALYASSLVPSERGNQLTLDQCYYGDEEHDPIRSFIEIMDNYPQLWAVSKRLEGVITRLGIHASGVILSNEDIRKYNSIMKTSKGTIVTAYDLHDSEEVGGVKYDFLSIDGLGTIHTALIYLLKDKVIEWKGSLKKTYKHYLWPNILKYSEELWENIAGNKINGLWQLNTSVGTAALSSVHATSLKEVGIINSLMRLMPQNKGDENPVATYVRFKNDLNQWYNEMTRFGLNQDEIKVMEDHLLVLNGIADTQESVMMMVMDERISNFTLVDANKLRKGIAKKSVKAQEEAKALFYSKGKQVGTRIQLLDYVWKIQISRQLGYSFSLPHVAAYSMIAIQQANLYTYYPSIYWNTACLVSASGGVAEEDLADLIKLGYVKASIQKRIQLERMFEYYQQEIDDEELTEEQTQEVMQSLYENLEDEDSKTNTQIDRGKVAAAIGQFQKTVDIEPPSINESGYSFIPDAKTNTIISGLKIVGKMGDKLINSVIISRPYNSFDDFLSKVKISKDRVVLLIKANAFRRIDSRDRMELLKDYVLKVSDQKKRLTLQNVQMLIKYNLLPSSLSKEIKIYNWVKYIRKSKLDKTYYILDNRAFAFYQDILDESKLQYFNNNGEQITAVSMSYVDLFYNNQMNAIRSYIAANHNQLLDKLNHILFMEEWNKYKMDSIEQGEMQSMRVYIKKHVLDGIEFNTTITPLNEIEDSKTNGSFLIDGQLIPRFEIYTIVGAVINKNKLKTTVTLLTPDGPVDVKIWKNSFSYYDQTIVSMENGEKVIKQKSFFENGTLLMVTGRLRDGIFVPKKYKNTKVEDVIIKLELTEDGVTYETKQQE